MDEAVGFGPLQVRPYENLLKEIFEVFETDIIEDIISSYKIMSDDDPEEGFYSGSDEEDDSIPESLNLQQKFFRVLNRSKDKLESAKILKRVMGSMRLHHEGQSMVEKVKVVVDQLKQYQRQEEARANEIFVGRDRDIQLCLGLLGDQFHPDADLSTDDKEKIRRVHRGIKGVYVSGIGGQGKTSLARKISDILSRGPEQWKTMIVSLRNKYSPEDVLQAVLAAVDVLCTSPRLDDLKKQLIGFIKDTTQNTLICLDDCDAIDRHAMNWFLTDLFRQIDNTTPSCKVKFLLTSRSKFEDNKPVERREDFELKIGGSLFELKLDSLMDEEAVELLMQCSGSDIEELDEDMAHNIVTFCSLTPLAITMVAQSLKSGKFTPRQLLFHLKKDQRHATKEMKMDRCIKEIFDTFDEQLKESLIQLAVFQSSKFDLRSAKKIIAKEEPTKVLQTLHDYHFLEVVPKSRKHGDAEKDYSLHPLVYRFIAEKLKAVDSLERKSYSEAVVRFVEIMESKVGRIYKMMSTKCKKGMAEMEENKTHIMQFYDLLLDKSIHPLLKKYPKFVKDKFILVKKNVSDITDLILPDVKKRRLFLSEAERAKKTGCDAMYIFWTIERADVLSTLHQNPILGLQTLDELSAGRYAALRRLHDQPDYPPLVMALFHKVKGQCLWKLLRHEEAMKHLDLALHFYNLLPEQSYEILKAKLLKTKGVLLLELKELDKAEATLNEAFEMIKDQVIIKDPRDIRAKEMQKQSLLIPEFFRHFGAILVEKCHIENDLEKRNKNLNKALELLHEGMALDKQLHIDSLDDFAAKQKLCADIYMEQGLLDEAERYAEEAERQRRHCLQLPHIHVTESVYQMGKIYMRKGQAFLQKGNTEGGNHYFRCAEDWFSELESDHLINGSIPTTRHPLYCAIKNDHLALYKQLDKKKFKKLAQFYADIENGKYDKKIKSYRDDFESMMFTPQEILDKMYDGGGEEFGANDSILVQPGDDEGVGSRSRIDSGRGGSSFENSLSSMSESGSLDDGMSRMHIQKSTSVEDEVFQQDPKISLNEILLRDGEMVISDMLYLKILSTKEPVTYTNKTGVATMKEIVIADSTAYSKAISYDAKNFPLLVNDECIIITNFIKKPDRSIIITSQTNVFSTSTSLVTIPEEIRKEAQEKKITTVLDASMSPQKTVLTVQGKIVKAAPSCKKSLSMTSEEVSFKRIKLKDESGTVEVGLWREMAESQVKEGDYVALNNFYVTSRYHKEKRSQIPILASQKKNSSVQFLPNSDDNLSDDASDFEEEKNQKKEGVLIGLQSIHIYPSCINTRCNFKKLGDKLQCTNCKITYSQASAGKGFVVKVLIQEEGFKVYTIFTEAMNGLLKSVNLTDSTDIMQDMKQIMPLKVSFHAESDKLKFIVASSC